MRKALILVLLAAAVAPAARAKGPHWTALRVCGESGCRVVDATRFFVPSVAGGVTAPAFARYYTIEPLPDRAVFYWVPSAGAVRTLDLASAPWYRVENGAALHRAVRGIEPFPEPRVSAALVDGRPARDPASYRLVYELRSPRTSPRDPLRELLGGALSLRAFRRLWIPIALRSARPSPWTDDWSFVWISRRGSRLARAGETLAIPPTLARRIRSGEPLY